MSDRLQEMATNACRRANDEHLFEVNDMVTRESVASAVRSTLEQHKESGEIQAYNVRVQSTDDGRGLHFTVNLVDPSGRQRHFDGEMR